MRKLLAVLAVVSLLCACTSKNDEQHIRPVAKGDRTDHLLEDVQTAPTYGDKMLKTYQGAQNVKKKIDSQTAEQKDLLKDSDGNQ